MEGTRFPSPQATARCRRGWSERPVDSVRRRCLDVEGREHVASGTAKFPCGPRGSRTCGQASASGPGRSSPTGSPGAAPPAGQPGAREGPDMNAPRKRPPRFAPPHGPPVRAPRASDLRPSGGRRSAARVRPPRSPACPPAETRAAGSRRGRRRCAGRAQRKAALAPDPWPPQRAARRPPSWPSARQVRGESALLELRGPGRGLRVLREEVLGAPRSRRLRLSSPAASQSLVGPSLLQQLQQFPLLVT